MMWWVRRLLRLGLEFRLWVALCVTALCLFCEQTLFGTSNGPSVVYFGSSARIVMASTLALYNFDGVIDCQIRHTPGKKRASTHLALTILASLWLLFELVHVGTWLMPPIVVGFVACTSYAIRLVILGYPIRLKTVPGLKSPFVGTAVGIAVVLVPLLCDGPQMPAHLFDSSTASLAASLCCLCTANAQLFDLPDLVSDQNDGVKTTPVLLGEKVSKLIGLGWISLGAAFGAMTEPLTRYPLFVLGFVLFLATGVVKKTSPKSQVAFWVDGALCLPLFVRTILH